MGRVEYLRALGIFTAFFAGRGTANAGACDRGCEDGFDNAVHGSHRSSVERRQPAVRRRLRGGRLIMLAQSKPLSHAPQPTRQRRGQFGTASAVLVLDRFHGGNVHPIRAAKP